MVGNSLAVRGTGMRARCNGRRYITGINPIAFSQSQPPHCRGVTTRIIVRFVRVAGPPIPRKRGVSPRQSAVRAIGSVLLERSPRTASRSFRNPRDKSNGTEYPRRSQYSPTSFPHA